MISRALVSFWEKTRPLYRPLAWVYGLAVGGRNWIYARGWRRRRHPGVFSVAVGNLSLGGEGKTPFTLALAELFQALGGRPVVILRGYGGRTRGPLVVSEGRGPLVSAELSGEEARLYALRLSGVPVVVGRDRLAAAELAIRHFAPRVLLFDDAFQHLRLKPDLNLLVVSASRDPFSEKLFPAGRLREPVSAARRATAVFITRANLFPQRARELARRFQALGLTVHLLSFESGPLVSLAGGRLFPYGGGRPRRVVAFCAIGEPEDFRRTLETRGFEVLHFETFPDHYFYRRRDLESLVKRGLALGAEALLTTEKDLVKLPRCDFPLPVLALSLLVRLPGETVSWFENHLPFGTS